MKISKFRKNDYRDEAFNLEVLPKEFNSLKDFLALSGINLHPHYKHYNHSRIYYYDLGLYLSVWFRDERYFHLIPLIQEIYNAKVVER